MLGVFGGFSVFENPSARKFALTLVRPQKQTQCQTNTPNTPNTPIAWMFPELRAGFNNNRSAAFC
jgi:hypothetical protein